MTGYYRNALREYGFRNGKCHQVLFEENKVRALKCCIPAAADVQLCQGAPTEKAAQCQPPGTFWSPLPFQKYFSRQTYASTAASGVLETPPTDNRRQNANTAEKAADECTDGDMDTLITTVEYIHDGSTDSGRH
jgi:hypothetical protein